MSSWGAQRVAWSALVLGGLMSGCGSQTIIRTVTSTGQGSPTAQKSASPAQQAKLGATLTLAGNDGESMVVTVDQVMDPLPVGQFDQPDSGQRFVGVQITLKNVGSVAYSDSPSNGATLLSDTNEQATSEDVSGGPCGNDFESSANIAPGNTQQGCIPFEMPTGQAPGTFQFTLDSGFANQTGQWSLLGAAASTTSTPASTPNTASIKTSTTSGNTPCYEGPCVMANMPNQCSHGLAATSSISCGLASSVFYEYFKATQTGSGAASTLSAWSPATKRYYSADCSASDGLVSCSVSGTRDPNAQVVMTQAAVSAYSPQQASAYTASHNAGPNG